MSGDAVEHCTHNFLLSSSSPLTPSPITPSSHLNLPRLSVIPPILRVFHDRFSRLVSASLCQPRARPPFFSFTSSHPSVHTLNAPSKFATKSQSHRKTKTKTKNNSALSAYMFFVNSNR